MYVHGAGVLMQIVLITAGVVLWACNFIVVIMRVDSRTCITLGLLDGGDAIDTAVLIGAGS